MAIPDVSLPPESLTTMIPCSLTVTPPAPPSKRQRSRESRKLASQPASTCRETDDGPPPSPGLRIPAFLNHTKADILMLFQELEWRQRFRIQHALNNPASSPYRTDRSPTITSRNRYGNVQPWAASRVKLKVPIDGSDYVNASPISLKSRTGTTTSSGPSIASLNQSNTAMNVDLPESKYIATQGPKDGHFAHFWNMVMQETVGDVGVVVMLTPCWEGNKEKCGQYYPVSRDMPMLDLEIDGGNDQSSSSTGDLFLDSDPMSADADRDPAEEPGSLRSTPDTHEGSDNHGSVTLLELSHDTKSRSEVRKLKLRIGDETKTIWHYLFNGWPDYGKPEGEDRRALLELISQTAVKAGDPRRNPRFVHCSAGVGRTGTFIALDHLLRELAHGKLEVAPSRPSSSGQLTQTSQEGSDDAESLTGSFPLSKETTPEAKEDAIFETVNQLREQRMMMVMNDIQFSFLYEVLRELYVDMYSSPARGRGIAARNAGLLGELADENQAAAAAAIIIIPPVNTAVDSGEPSPKMARTANMLSVGSSTTALREKKEEVERQTANGGAVAANGVLVRIGEEGLDPYAAVDPEVVAREKKGAEEGLLI